MKQVNIHAAKTQLSALVQMAAAGEPFIIAKSGRPMVVVRACEQPAMPERTGFMKGQIKVPADFDRMGSEDIASMFEVGP